MLLSVITTVALAATGLASAIPSIAQRQVLPVCLGTYGNAQCCATDVLNLADLNCIQPPTTPTSADDFEAICAAEGQQAKCCALPILGQALLCQDPV